MMNDEDRERLAEVKESSPEEKMRLLADWFDGYDDWLELHMEPREREVQADLRMWAKTFRWLIERLEQADAEVRYEQERNENNVTMYQEREKALRDRANTVVLYYADVDHGPIASLRGLLAEDSE